MRVWKRITGIAVVFAAVATMATAGEAAREGGQRMSPEERAKLAQEAAPLAAKAIADYVGLSAEEAKKFTAAYVAESAAARNRVAEAMQSGDREQMMSVWRENGEKMRKVLEENLKPDQVKKAAGVLGRFNSLDWSIRGLLQTKVEKAKAEKALPVLVKFAVAQQELFGQMRDGSVSREDVMGKLGELREKTAKELAPIVGEEAAKAWQENMGMRGMRRGGGRRGGGGGGNQ
jgi:hypothetical protein